MIRSMTGFGAGEGLVGGATVSVELRTVNHRFFNPNIKLPGRIGRFEGDVREALRKRIARGHVACTVRLARDEAVAGAAIDETRFGAYVARLRDLQNRYGLGGHVELDTILRLPNVVVHETTDEADHSTVEEVLAVVEAALEALTRMRTEEGARLAQVLRERLDVIEQVVGRIAARAPDRLIAQRDRLRSNVRELAAGVAINEDRLAQEIAILADRLDVHEELDRFGSHLAAFREALATQDGEPVGKRLGFLVQELLREANTTGSKANDAVIARDVVGIKEELERIREQVENLE